MPHNILFVALVVFLTSQINRLLPINKLEDMPADATPSVLRWGLIMGSLVAGIFLLAGWYLLSSFVESQSLLGQLLVVTAIALFLEKVWWLLYTARKWPIMPPTWGSLIFSIFAVLTIVLVPFLTWQEVMLGIIAGTSLVTCLIILDSFSLLISKHYRWWEVLSSIPLMVLAIKAL